jgi:hypothetical protein
LPTDSSEEAFFWFSGSSRFFPDWVRLAGVSATALRGGLSSNNRDGWDSEVVPMLEAVPGLRPVSIVTEMLRPPQ